MKTKAIDSRKLYESIMARVSETVKNAIDEAYAKKLGFTDEVSITDDRTDPALTQYLRDINRYPVGMSHEEYCQCYDIMHDEDATEQEKNDARNKIINSSLRFVIKVIKKYRLSGVYCSIPMIDLIQAGNIGLAKAADNYNPYKTYEKDGEIHHYEFITYAVRWIQREVFETFDKEGGITRVSQTTTLMHRAIKRFSERFYAREERMPNNVEIFDALKEMPEWKSLTWDSFMQTMDNMQRPGSLDDTTANDEGDTVTMGARMASDTFERPGASLDKEDLQNRLRDVMVRIIGTRWTSMLFDKYGIGRPDGIPMTDLELQQKYGVGRAMIVQMVREKTAKIAKDQEARKLMAEYMS